MALVTYEGKVDDWLFWHLLSYLCVSSQRSPQMWKIDMIKDRASSDPSALVARLSLRCTYGSKGPVDFVGSSQFGGKEEELIVTAGTSKLALDSLSSSEH